MERFPLKQMVLCALFAALMAVCAQISFAVGPVPITLSMLPVFLCAALQKKQYAALTMVVYALMGLVGLPVFSNFGAGPAKLLGATGGYILGYIPCAFVTALLIQRLGRAWWKQALAMVVGLMVCYAFGTAWFMLTKGTGLMASLSACVFPFLPGDALKIALAVMLALRLHGPMQRMGM